MRLIFCLSVLLIFKNDAILAQEKYSALTGVITFAELQNRKVTRQVEWVNPDGNREQMSFVEMAIPIDESRKELTRAFMVANYGRDSIWLRPEIIVFHAMGDGDLKTSLEVSSFLHDKMPANWGNLPFAGKLPNGAHFIIEKNGEVICLSPPFDSNGSISFEKTNHHWMVKRHQDANPVAIGIENVTDRGDLTTLTPDQITSNAKLARWLLWFESGKIKYVSSHHQFNSDINYDKFLKAFQLKHLQKNYRTRERKDIGDKNLGEIAGEIRKSGWSIASIDDLFR